MHIDGFLVELALVTIPLFLWASWLAVKDKEKGREGDEPKPAE